MSLGRLENFNLGMGLAANRDDVIPSRHASFDGFEDATPSNSTSLVKKAAIIVVLAGILLLISKGSK